MSLISRLTHSSCTSTFTFGVEYRRRRRSPSSVSVLVTRRCGFSRARLIFQQINFVCVTVTLSPGAGLCWHFFFSRFPRRAAKYFPFRPYLRISSCPFVLRRSLLLFNRTAQAHLISTSNLRHGFRLPLGLLSKLARVGFLIPTPSPPGGTWRLHFPLHWRRKLSGFRECSVKLICHFRSENSPSGPNLLCCAHCDVLGRRLVPAAATTRSDNNWPILFSCPPPKKKEKVSFSQNEKTLTAPPLQSPPE